MQSMTGYGKAEFCEGGISLVVELKTVNNRFLDVIPKYPRSFISLDDLIRKTVQNKIKRGRIELFISYTNTEDNGKSIEIDKNLASGYVEASRILAEEFNLQDDLTSTYLMRCPDVITEKVNESSEDKISAILTATLNEALDNLNAMREVEGEKLKRDVLSRCSEVERLVGEIEARAPMIKSEYESRLKVRMTEILGDVKYDETRLLTEVAIFADKSNIDEEITRLKSHISQLRTICEGKDDVGKKLDFLMQEFNRETNTVCSKSNDVKLTKFGLALKNEIENMREQVQNIE